MCLAYPGAISTASNQVAKLEIDVADKPVCVCVRVCVCVCVCVVCVCVLCVCVVCVCVLCAVC